MNQRLLKRLILQEIKRIMNESHDTHWHGDWTPDEPEDKFSNDPCDEYWPNDKEEYDRCREKQFERMNQETSGDRMNPAWESRSRKGKRI